MIGYKPAFPASVDSLAQWIAELGNRRLEPKTVKSYLTGIRSAHIDLGYYLPKVFESPVLERLIKSIRRMHGKSDTQERLPFIKDLLLQVLP